MTARDSFDRLRADSYLRSEVAANRDCHPNLTRLIEIKLIELHRVVVDDFVGDVIGNSGEVLFDDLSGVGPGAVAVREVRGPHIIVLAIELVGDRTDGIVLEGCPHLAAN